MTHCVFLPAEQACTDRYSMRPEIWEWLFSRIGPFGCGWTFARVRSDDKDGYWFYIKDSEAAMLFKLTWT